ncbi:MAG TPA: RDD family protein [Thermoanaerobaculia bacterium]|nr:RDD family protein [Thermoanaerobaculia bacterium]
MICRNHVDVMEGIRRCARCQTPYCRNCLVEIQGRPYCADCKSEQLLDVRSGVNSATLNYSGIWKRFGAVFLDGLVVNLPLYLIMMGIGFAMSSTRGEPHPLVAFAGIPLMFAQMLYEGAMLSAKNGQTLGKIAMRVRVVRADGSPISTGQAWGRSAMKLVLGCLWIVDYIPAFFTVEKTTLHDMVAGTRVVEIG